MAAYLPQLQGQRVGLVVNHTSTVGAVHLVDTLRSRGVDVVRIFTPEHGFRGTADAGERVDNATDAATGLPLVSLYGQQKGPSAAHLRDLDVLVFDLQDVGARFYTYISTLHYVMQAGAEHQVSVLVLDRPNPNGHYVDGPVRTEKLRSFVGMHPIPIVHGLTVGELAGMINGEGWLGASKKCRLTVVPVRDYTHQTPYSVPVRPSPNLPNDQAIALYPSLCLFEGTRMSVGRGTPMPFQVMGAPDPAYGDFTFTPVSTPGAAKNPLYENQLCYGQDLRQVTVEGFTLRYVLDAYARSPEKDKFFNNFFNTLVGNADVQAQIRAGKSEAEIRAGWTADLTAYRALRKRYLLYAE